MQAVHFDQAIRNILEQSSRFEAGAYYFLKDALDFTVKRAEEQGNGKSRHVTASELLIGFKDLALQEYGPMAATLMEEWNIGQCSDIGDMVFELIEQGMFGKQESDEREDFKEIFTFDEAFRKPFQPKVASV